MRHWPLVAAAAAIALAAQGRTHAADPRFPDWPCVQIKVPEISLAAVWAGPAIDDVDRAWENNRAINDLVTKLAGRRTPIEEAERTVAGFITGAPAEKQEKAKLLFAAVFAALNRERSEIMTGIERFTRRQRDFAQTIRSETQELRELQDKADQDQSKIDELVNRLEWKTRIFEERRKTIGYVCEVPVLIERRLFSLGRAIQQALE
jgi:hypothetical protein